MLRILFLLTVSFIGIYLNVWFLLMVFQNKSRLNDTKRPKRYPSISIIVPAYNEARTLAKTLKSILNLDYPKGMLDAIVVDNGSTDGTFNVAKRFEKSGIIRAFRIPVKGKAYAANFGLKHAKGELIGVLDADTYATKDCLKNMVGYFEDPSVGAVTNHVKVESPHGILPSLQDIEYIFSAFTKKLVSLLDALYVIPGTLSLIRKKSIEGIGFSDDTVTEDMDVALCMLKRNYRIVTAFEALSYTDVPSSLIGLLRQRTRWYRGYIQNLRKHSDMLFNRRFPHLGFFVLPVAGFLAIFVGSVLTVSLAFNSVKGAIMFLKDMLYIPILEKVAVDIGSMSFASFILEPYSTVTYASILIGTMIVMVVSFRTLKVSIKKKLIVLPLYFFIYYSLIMVFWMISAFMELVGWKKEW